LFGQPPDYSVLKPFGCACFVLLQPHEHTKLQPQARLCCLLGYGNEHKGFRCWDPISNRLRISRHVVFWENTTFSSFSKFHHSVQTDSFFFTNSSIDLFSSTNPGDSSALTDNSLPHDPLESVPAVDPALVPATTPVNPLHRSTRVRETPHSLAYFHCYSAITTLHEPRSYREASTDPLWQQTMSEEFQALEKTHT
jgi:hypothetical protein